MPRKSRCATLRQPFEDALNVTHAEGFVNILDGGQGFGIGRARFWTREVHETAFQHIERNLGSGSEQLGERVTVRSARLTFLKLSDTFIQPSRAAIARHLRDEGVCQFVFEHACKFRSDAIPLPGCAVCHR